MIATLPLAPFVIINLTRLTAGVCMKVRFKSKVTRGFVLLAASRLDFPSSRPSRGSRETSGTRVQYCSYRGIAVFKYPTPLEVPVKL